MSKIWAIYCCNCCMYLVRFDNWTTSHHYFTRQQDFIISHHLQFRHKLEFRRVYR